jgi:phage-related protein
MKKANQCNKPIRFVNKASKKCFEKLPGQVKAVYLVELEDFVAMGLEPTIDSEPLPGQTIELKVNGSPAYRCVYKVLEDVIVILHSFKKTCQGPCKKNMKTLSHRLKKINPSQFC